MIRGNSERLVLAFGALALYYNKGRSLPLTIEDAISQNYR